MESMILCCIILHNMLINEKETTTEVPARIPYNIKVTPPDPNQQPLTNMEIIFRHMDLQLELKHSYLLQDLVDLQWENRCPVVPNGS